MLWCVRSKPGETMRIPCFATLLAVCLFLAPFAAVAQDAPLAKLEPGLTTIVMTQNVAAPLKEGQTPRSQQDEALRSFFGLVGGTCGTILETVADTCEITNITFNFRWNAESSRANRPDQPATIRIDGQVQMLVKLKAEVGPPSPENSTRPRNRPTNVY